MKKETLSSERQYMELECIMLSKVSQTQSAGVHAGRQTQNKVPESRKDTEDYEAG